MVGDIYLSGVLFRQFIFIASGVFSVSYPGFIDLFMVGGGGGGGGNGGGGGGGG